jgi:hypothetical protein
MPTIIGTILLAHQEADQERTLRTGMMSQNFAVRTLRRDGGLIAQIDEAVPDPSRQAVLVLDSARAAAERLTFIQVADYLRVRHPQVRLAVIAGRALAVNALHDRWVQRHGGIGAFGRSSRHRFVASQRALIEALCAHFGAQLDVARLRDFEAVLLSGGSIDEEDFADTQRVWDQLERAGVDPLAIGMAMVDQWGVRSEDRSYRGKVYPDCFTGVDAARWLNARLALPRSTALMAGEVARSAGVFYHVARDHGLKDADLYYRANRVTPRLRDLDIDVLLDAARGIRGLEVAVRNWRGVSFPKCFVGAQATLWLTEQAHLSLGEAITLGQCLLDLHIFRHVTDDHDFIDRDFFYRFAADRP